MHTVETKAYNKPEKKNTRLRLPLLIDSILNLSCVLWSFLYKFGFPHFANITVEPEYLFVYRSDEVNCNVCEMSESKFCSKLIKIYIINLPI